MDNIKTPNMEVTGLDELSKKLDRLQARDSQMEQRITKIIREAIKADTDLMQTIGNRLQATCFEVSPEEPDNTPLPYITIIYGHMQGQQLTKDDLWMPEEWQRTVTVEIAARSTNDVEQIMWQVVKAVARYVDSLAENGDEYPQLDALNATDIAWDWTKPCYYQNLIYQCTIYNV